jgi:hypothetical protein
VSDAYCGGEAGIVRQFVGGINVDLVYRPLLQDPVFCGQDIKDIWTITILIGVPALVAGVGVRFRIQYAQLCLRDIAGVDLAIAGGVAQAVARSGAGNRGNDGGDK